MRNRFKTIDNKLQRVTEWWARKNTRPLFGIAIGPKTAPPDLNAFWPRADAEPDIDGMVAAQIQGMSQVPYLADTLPLVYHNMGGRGTPMTMAAYLGGDVRFDDTNVWVGPVVEDWNKFPFEFNLHNPWVQRSRRLMEAHVRLLPDGFLPVTPDYGDALTVFSLLRGTERLLLDLVEQPDVIERKVREYVEVWIKAHRYFWDIYRTRFPGDCSVLGWAPGRTYICQSDFSTMISPAMFERFVVPEIVRLGEYLEYMPWHLDGPEEIKHLGALLDLPQIKAIQLQPGANRPTCASPLWLPEARKIQARGRGLFVCANTVAELETLMDNLAPEGLCIGVFPRAAFTDISQAEPFLQAFERRYG